MAQAAREAGAQVVLVSGPTALPAPYQVLRVDVESAAQMHAAVMNEARDADIFISVAAVADWRVLNASDNKLNTQADGQAPHLAFEANPDILAAVPRIHSGPWRGALAADTQTRQDGRQN